ncbi:MAG: hypothetical protein ACJAVW_003215 [Spirosomataceae bacterium]|jgi:hypothetical protein
MLFEYFFAGQHNLCYYHRTTQVNLDKSFINVLL